jgi:hypothetical protein
MHQNQEMRCQQKACQAKVCQGSYSGEPDFPYWPSQAENPERQGKLEALKDDSSFYGPVTPP